MVRFSANTVVVDDSNSEFILVGFADEQDGRYRESLHFQRSYEYDDQDIVLGMDSVYAERKYQSQGGYGGVKRIELHSNHVRVRFDDRLGERMGDNEFEISLSLLPAELERLRRGLRTVFCGSDVLVEGTSE